MQPGVAFLYPLKTSENLRFSGGIEKQHQAVMGYAYLLPALKNSVNLMPVAQFYSKLKLSVRILKRLH